MIPSLREHSTKDHHNSAVLKSNREQEETNLDCVSLSRLSSSRSLSSSILLSASASVVGTELRELKASFSLPSRCKSVFGNCRRPSTKLAQCPEGSTAMTRGPDNDGLFRGDSRDIRLPRGCWMRRRFRTKQRTRQAMMIVFVRHQRRLPLNSSVEQSQQSEAIRRATIEASPEIFSILIKTFKLAQLAMSRQDSSVLYAGHGVQPLSVCLKETCQIV
jgi:hypothetical protein